MKRVPKSRYEERLDDDGRRCWRTFAPDYSTTGLVFPDTGVGIYFAYHLRPLGQPQDERHFTNREAALAFAHFGDER